MTHGLVGLLLAGLLAGCASDTVRIPKAQLALTYADTRAAVAVAIARLSDACAARRIPAATCDQLRPLVAQAQALDLEARALLTQKGATFDLSRLDPWLGLLLKLAPLAVGL